MENRYTEIRPKQIGKFFGTVFILILIVFALSVGLGSIPVIANEINYLNKPFLSH